MSRLIPGYAKYTLLLIVITDNIYRLWSTVLVACAHTKWLKITTHLSVFKFEIFFLLKKKKTMNIYNLFNV